MFIDTHCHLNLLSKKDFDIFLDNKDIESLKPVLAESEVANVKIILTVGTSLIESKNCIKIAKKFKKVFAVIGIHPCDCKESWKKDLEEIFKFLENKKVNKIVGIGETGLDFYHKPFDEGIQIEVFEKHIQVSIEKKLPLVVHVRESAEKVFEILKIYRGDVRGVIHCFFQNKDYAKKFLDLGFYLGINAPITYPKNDWFRDVVKYIPLEKILLETDAPFLPPQQFRGSINYPKYIPIFAKVLADIKDVDINLVENLTTKNAKNLFEI